MDFGKFTTLTGESNGGKSSVLRALIGLVRNDSAANYVRLGQKALCVTVEMDDGHIIEWHKGDKTNKYILTEPDGTKNEYDKVGSEAPEDVREVLKLGPVAVKGSDKEYVNFHNQLESPFLISATPGTVAKLFGELTSASQLYTAVGEGNRQVRSTNSLKSTRKDDLDSARERLLDYVDLPAQEEDLLRATEQFEQAKAVQGDIEACESILRRIEALTETADRTDQMVAQLEPVLVVDLDEAEQAVNETAAFAKLVLMIKDRERSIVDAQEKLEALGTIPDVDFDAIESLDKRIRIVEKYVGGYASLSQKEETLQALVRDNTTVVNDYEAQITVKFNELEECPECGQDLDDHAKGTLVEGRVAHAAH